MPRLGPRSSLKPGGEGCDVSGVLRQVCRMLECLSSQYEHQIAALHHEREQLSLDLARARAAQAHSVHSVFESICSESSGWSPRTEPGLPRSKELVSLQLQAVLPPKPAARAQLARQPSIDETMSCGDSADSSGRSAGGDAPQRLVANLFRRQAASMNLGGRDAEAPKDPSGVRRTSQTSSASDDNPEYDGPDGAACHQSVLRPLVKSNRFEAVFIVLIIVNCVSMGFQVQFDVTGKPEVLKPVLAVTEHVFIALFTSEFVLRFVVYGWRSYVPTSSANLWNCMDAVLVFTGILAAWVLPLVSVALGGGSNELTFRTLILLRACRIMRVIRVVRKVQMFHEVWFLLQGLRDSMRTLLWTSVVTFFVTYVFAVFGMAIVSKDIYDAHATTDSVAEKAELDELLEYVGTLDLFLVTLMQVLTVDSWNMVTRRIQKFSPFSWIFFYAYIAVAYIVLMNLVTAIIVQNALDTSKADEEKQLLRKDDEQKQEHRKLKHLFRMMDTDGDGTLSWEEFKEAFEQPEVLAKWKLLNFNAEECQELFKLLDTGDGCIRLEDFHEGLVRMRGAAQSKDMFRVMKKLDKLADQANVAGMGRLSADGGFARTATH